MTLRDELLTDPLGRGYSSLSDQQAADDLNTIYRSRNKTSMNGDELFAATDTAQYGGLSAADRLLWVSFCGRETIDPFGSANVAFVTDMFGGGSPTLSALASARVEAISRATELRLGTIKPGHVMNARA